MKILVKCYNTTKCFIKFGIGNYIYEKKKLKGILMEQKLFIQDVWKKRREGCKGRIIIVQNELEL